MIAGPSFIDGIISQSHYAGVHGFDLHPSPIASYGGRAASMPSSPYDMSGRMWMPPMQAPSNVIIPAPPFHSHLATWQPWPMQTSIPILNQAQPSHNARVHSYSPVQSQSPMRQESPMRKRGVASPRAVSRANIAPNADPRSVLKAGTSQILSPLDARAKAPPEPKAVHSGDLWSNAWHEENSNPCKADRPKWKTTLGHFATNSADPWQGQWFAMNSSPHNAHRPKWDDTLVQ